MPSKTVKVVTDTYINQDAATTNYSTVAKLIANGQTSHKKYILLVAPKPFPLDATVTSAVLRLRTTASWASGAPHTVTAYRISNTWKVNQATFTNSSTLITNALANSNPGSVTTSAAAANTAINIDVTAMMNDVAGGSAYHGLLVAIDTTGNDSVWSANATNDYQPELIVTWALLPDAPTDLRPADTAVIGTANPLLAWNKLVDPDGAATQADSQVEVDATSSAMGALVYNSGMIANTKAQWNLDNAQVEVITLTGFSGTDSFKLTYNAVEGATTYTRGTNATAAALQTGLRTLTGDSGLTVTGTTDAGPFTVTFSAGYTDGVIGVAGATATISVTSPSGCTGAVAVSTRGGYTLTNGTTYYWRVRVKDSNGNTSADWSDVQSFTYKTVSAVTITSPATSLDDSTPAVVWTFGGTQTAYRITIYDNVLLKTTYDTHRVASTDQSVTIPHTAAMTATDSGRYTITVYVWDDQTRADIPNDPAYQSASVTCTYAGTGSVTKVLTLAATNTYATVTLTLTRAAQPDFFCLRVSTDGGSTYAVPKGTDPHGNAWSRLDPTDYFTSGTTYVIEYLNAQPGVDTYYAVHAVVSDGGSPAKFQESTGDPTDHITADPPGLWLIETTANTQVVVIGQDSKDWSVGEDATEYYPVGRQDPVRVTTSIRGYEGTITGELQAYGGFTATQLRENLETIKQLGSDATVRLIVGTLNIPVRIGQVKLAPVHPTGYNVSIDFSQVDEFAINTSGLS